jgi:sigma-B regulation protein RsbU (phosphoserine phosphatase)
MKLREPSLVWRLAGLILGGAGSVLLATLVFNHFAQRTLIIETQRKHSDALTLSAVNHIEIQVGRTESAVQSAALAWSLLPGDRASTVTLIQQTLRTQPQLFGLTVAWVPEEKRGQDFTMLYGFRDQAAVRLDDEANPAEYLKEWYKLPLQLRRPVWTEPYSDPAAQASLVSFSVPVLRDGRVVAIVTGDLSLAWLRDLLDRMPLGKGGTAVLLSTKGVFISHPDRKLEMKETIFSFAETLSTPAAVAELKDLGRSMLRRESGQRIYHDPINGGGAYVNYRPVSSIGWALVVLLPEEEMLAPLNHQTRINLLVGAGGLALLLLAAAAVAYSLTAPLKRLAAAARLLATGHFDTPLPAVRRRDEVGRLTESFETMRTDLRDYIDRLTTTTAAKEKISSELAIARQIQLGIVPKLFPPFPHRKDLDLHACLEPAREVGGDLYDFALLDDDHLYLAIGDVSGKGVPASLLMAVGKTLLKSTIQAVRDPARALALVNDDLAEHNDSCMFITAFCGILNLQTGELSFANAGQNPPLLVRAGGGVELLQGKPGAPLAAMPGSRYASHSLRLEARDLLLLYTDGVTEAMNAALGMFDEARLIELARRECAAPARILIERLVAAVRAHAAGAEQSDDITVLALRVASYPKACIERQEREPDSSLLLLNSKEELPKLVAWVEALGAQQGLPAPLVMNLNLALEEWFANLVSYAFVDQAGHSIQFRVWYEAELLHLEIEDDGRPFDPTAQAIPDTAAGLEQRKIGGLGIHFIRRVMAGMRYRRAGGHNVLTLEFRLR